MYRHTLYIGLSWLPFSDGLTDRDLEQKPEVRRIKNLVLTVYGGFTAAIVDGGWQNDGTGQVSHERTLRLEVITDSDNVLALAEHAAAMFRLSEVIVVTERVELNRYSRPTYGKTVVTSSESINAVESPTITD
jgi:hypothetical protein